MNTFHVEIRTDNAAFDDDANTEVARILRGIADALEEGAREGLARDANGADVGRYSYATN